MTDRDDSGLPAPIDHQESTGEFEQIPDREVFTRELQGILDAHWAEDQKLQLEVWEYIRGCNDWRLGEVRIGGHNLHFEMQTSFEGSDGATLVMIGLRVPLKDLDGDDVPKTLDELYEAVLAGGHDLRQGDKCSTEFAQFILDNPERASIMLEKSTPFALSRLKQSAEEGTPLHTLLKYSHAYWMGQMGRVTGLTWGSEEYLEAEERYDAEQSYRMLQIAHPDEPLQATDIIGSAQRLVAADIADKLYRAREAKKLHDMLRHPPVKGFAESVRSTMQTHLTEILAGKTITEVLRTIEKLEDDMVSSDFWNRDVIEAIREITRDDYDQYPLRRIAEVAVRQQDFRLIEATSRITRQLSGVKPRPALGGLGLLATSE